MVVTYSLYIPVVYNIEPPVMYNIEPPAIWLVYFQLKLMYN